MKKNLFRFGSFNIKDDLDIRLWKDEWLRSTILRNQYSALYNTLSVLMNKGRIFSEKSSQVKFN
jgi:hypothetical protein